mgnify:CR=1 FL=1
MIKNFEEIAELHSVPEIVSYLKEKSSYSFVLNDLSDEQLHRGNIEKVLIGQLYYDYSKIYRFCGLEQRKFLELYVSRYEVDLINYCFRIVINHYSEPFDLNYKKNFFDKYSQISIDKLITSRTTDELIENLKDTEYYEPLKRLKENLTLLFLITTLLWINMHLPRSGKSEKSFKEKELEILTRDYGSKIDLLNLQWIYRAKKYYEMKPVDIYALLVPIHYKLSTELVKELVETPSVEEF